MPAEDKGIRALRARVTGSCDLLKVGAVNQTQVICDLKLELTAGYLSRASNCSKGKVSLCTPT